MAHGVGAKLENLVKAKVDEELNNITSTLEGSRVNKSVKDVAAAILPGIANIISVAVSTAISASMKELSDKMDRKIAEMQRYCLLNKYENDKLEQYSRRENLRILGLEEEADETEGVLEAKIIELAGDIGVKLDTSDISVAHRLGKPREGGRPVVLRLCHRKKKNEMMHNKKKLKGRQRKVYVNDDLTSLRAKMMNLVKNQEIVKNVSTREGSILAWLHSGGRPVVINTPDDLHKVGITNPDWKLLNLDHLVKV